MKKLISILFMLFTMHSFAQECEWIQHLDQQVATSSANFIVVDNNNNYYALVSVWYPPSTVIVGSDTLTFNSGTAQEMILVKYDSEGNVLWAKNSRSHGTTYQSHMLPSLYTRGLATDGENVYIVGMVTATSLYGNDSLYRSSDGYISVFFMKVDSSGNFQWSRYIDIEGNIEFYLPNIIYRESSNDIVFPVNARTQNPSIPTGILKSRDTAFNNVSLTHLSDGFLILFDTDGNFKRINQIVSKNAYIISIESSNDKLVASVHANTSVGYGQIDSLPMTNISSPVVCYDSSLNRVHIFEEQEYWAGRVSASKSAFYIASSYKDSIMTKDTVISGIGQGIALFKLANDNIENATYIKTFEPSSYVHSLIIADDMIYLAFRAYETDSLQYRNQIIKKNKPTDNYFLMKFDTLYNLLWAFPINLPWADVNLSVDKYMNLLAVSAFMNELIIFNDTLTNNGMQEYFLAKITDYSITRGEVSSGPYCAGDTFYVPYTQIGNYDTANFFIAELSDANGNFEGGERELGRLKATEDSTIIGQLPLFQVASSPNYRIRVRSTHPSVQSFYRLDSLRLLIYSRDKADPGLPETVCFGDSFTLNTFGGTAWQWSPAYRMDTPNARNPKIYPDRDTIFQIIISDSSGCGEPDTAFKQIFIRSNPQIEADTLLEACLNFDSELIANFSGGDSSEYKWKWYDTQDFDNWQEIESDSFSNTDTFFFRYPAGITNPRRFAVVLEDGCSVVKDTALITVRLSQNPMKGDLVSLDSLVCYQSEQTLIANFTGGDSNTYTWQWFETGFETPFNLLKADSLKTSDSLAVQLLPQNTLWQRYALVSQDECTPFVDTTYFTFNIVQNQPRATISPQDSAVCNGTPITLFASIDSGTALGHHWKWLDENETVLQSDTGFVVNPLEVTPDFSTQSSQTYTFILYDNCSPYSDTATLTVFPRDPLQAIPSVFDTTLCSGQEISLSTSGTGGDSNNYQFEWFATPDPSSGGEWILLSTEDTLNFLPSTENNSTLSTHNLKLVLKDNCMPLNDTVEVLVRVLPKLQVEILNQNGELSGDTTVCFGSEIVLSAIGKGGDSTNYSYEWFWNDSLISNDSNLNFTPIHLSPSTLHQLSLVLSDDCSPLDTTILNITILPPLSVLALIPDTLCLGEEIELFALPSGGIDTNYLYQWILNGNKMSEKDSFTLNGFHPSPSTLHLVLSDGCSSPNDTFTHEIYVRPALILDLSATTLCANPTTTLTANPTGGNPENYSIQWEATPDPSSGGEWEVLGTGSSIEVTPNQLTTYRAILTDGCSSDTAFTQIQIDLIPSNLTLSANPTEGCEPLEIEFEINTNYQDTFSGILFISDLDSIELSNLYGRIIIRPNEISPLSSGIYNPSFKFISKFGCEGELQFAPTITVHPKPIASFSYLPEEPDMDSAFVQFNNLSSGANSYLWTINPFGSFTDFEPDVEYKDTGYFDVSLIAISDQDCRDTTTGQVYIRTNYRVFLPNAFSPNGDGLNDVFRPTIRGFANMQFRVYNRWGELIYTSNSDEGWDGTYNGEPVQMGVYFYTLNVLNYFGEKQSFTGTVQLIR